MGVIVNFTKSEVIILHCYSFLDCPALPCMALISSLSKTSKLLAPLLGSYQSRSWRRLCHRAKRGRIAFIEGYLKRFTNDSTATHFRSSTREYSAMGKTDFHVETVIEIEKRFPFDGETVNRLVAAGASLVSEKSFIDTYYGEKIFCGVSTSNCSCCCCRLPVGTPERCALFTFFRTEGVAHELDVGKKGGRDVSGAGGTVALSLWSR